MFKHFLPRECAIKRAWRPLPQTRFIGRRSLAKGDPTAKELDKQVSRHSSSSATRRKACLPTSSLSPCVGSHLERFTWACPLGLLPPYSSEVVLRKTSVRSPRAYWLRTCILIIPKRFLYAKLWDILPWTSRARLPYVPDLRTKVRLFLRSGFCLRTYCLLL